MAEPSGRMAWKTTRSSGRFGCFQKFRGTFDFLDRLSMFSVVLERFWLLSASHLALDSNRGYRYFTVQLLSYGHKRGNQTKRELEHSMN